MFKTLQKFKKLKSFKKSGKTAENLWQHVITYHKLGNVIYDKLS